MHHIVGAQQHIALAVRKLRRQRAGGRIDQIAQRRARHHAAGTAGRQRGRHEDAVADEVRHEARGRAVVQRIGIVPLLQLPLVDHADHVADGKCLQLVVRDEQGRGACGLEDAAHLMRQALAQVHVEVGKRLVQQHQLRAGRQRAGQRHALLLAA